MAGRRARREKGGKRSRAAGVEIGAGALVLAWAVGQTARDASLPTALLFYVPSLVVATALLGVAAAVCLAHRRSLAIVLMAAPALLVGLVGEHRWLPRSPAPAQNESKLRLLHWNVSGGWSGLDQIADEIARGAPDVVALSEAPERVARRVAAELPGLEFRSLGALSVVAPRIDAVDWIERSHELQAITAKLVWRERSVRLVVVNLASSPWVPRRPSLERVRAVMGEMAPDLVVGDFNAPRRSRALERLPSGYRHAYEEAGWGWSASWPMPLPLLSLDHVLVGPRWRATSYALHGTPWSDHRLQLVELIAATQ